MLTVVGGVALAVAVGVGSALLPLINAEAYVIAAVARSPWAVVPIVVALSVGQTGGKVLLFAAARRGTQQLRVGPKLQALLVR